MELLAPVLHVDAGPFFALATVAALLAGISDLLWHKIPNPLSFSLIAAGIIGHVLLPWGKGWLFAAAGFGFGLVVLAPFFLLGGMGAGDVKLLAGIGACVGLHDIVAVFLIFGSLAGAVSAAVLLFHKLRHPNQAQALSAIAARQKRERVEEVLAQDPQQRERQLVPLAPMMAGAMIILGIFALRHGVAL